MALGEHLNFGKIRQLFNEVVGLNPAESHLPPNTRLLRSS
jgi:hypothetical protein